MQIQVEMGRLIVSVFLVLACSLPSWAQQVVQQNNPTNPISAICGRCCQQGTFCQPLAADAKLAAAAGGLQAGTLLPKGTGLTCYLRDRSAPGAVDGGLCVPQGVPNIPAFCNDYSQSQTSLLTNTVYQANLQAETQTCKPCCDGKVFCGTGLKCAKVVGGSQGVCIPSDDKSGGNNPNFCVGLRLNVADLLQCESCNAFSPLANAQVSRSSSITSGAAQPAVG